MTPSDLLRTAADYIEENGWCQGTSFREGEADHQPACAYSAMAIQTSPLSTLEEAVGLVCDELGHPHNAGYIIAYNDDPETTAEDVISTLRRAAARKDNR